MQGECLEDAFTARRELYVNLSTVVLAQCAAHESAGGQPIDQLDCAVVLNLQPFRQVGDASASSAGHAFYGKQKLVLLRLESSRARYVFAESEKAADLVAKFGDGLIVRKLKVGRNLLWSHIYIVSRYICSEVLVTLPGLLWEMGKRL